MDIEHVFDDGADCDLDDFEFDLGLEDEPIQSTVSKRRRRRRVGPVVVSSTPVKGDIRRYLPQLMTSVINSTEFPKLHTFFQTFMMPDGKFDLEYTGIFRNPVCESRGPKLTAFMFAGLGAIFPDLALTANNITISTNNMNAVSKITMDCSLHFSKIYDVTLEWALNQLQAAFRANQPNPHRDLYFQREGVPFAAQSALPVGKIGDKAGKKRTRNKANKKEADRFVFTIPSFSDAFNRAVPALQSAALAAPALYHTGKSDKCFDASTSTSACSSAPTSARSSECDWSDLQSLQSSVAPVATNSYDLSALAHSVFANVRQLAVPVVCYAHCTYTIIMDGNRIKSIHVSAMQPPPIVARS